MYELCTPCQKSFLCLYEEWKLDEMSGELRSIEIITLQDGGLSPTAYFTCIFKFEVKLSKCNVLF